MRLDATSTVSSGGPHAGSRGCLFGKHLCFADCQSRSVSAVQWAKVAIQRGCSCGHCSHRLAANPLMQSMHVGSHHSSPFEAVTEACALATATLISVARVVALAAATAWALSVHAVQPLSVTHSRPCTADETDFARGTVATDEQHPCTKCA